jgi:hypothetical protein
VKRAKKVPLVEASFGLKWGITDKKKSDTLDPNYYLFVNRVYDNIKNDYKYHEETKNYDKDGNLEISHQFRLSKTHSTYIELAQE